MHAPSFSRPWRQGGPPRLWGGLAAWGRVLFPVLIDKMTREPEGQGVKMGCARRQPPGLVSLMKDQALKI